MMKLAASKNRSKGLFYRKKFVFGNNPNAIKIYFPQISQITQILFCVICAICGRK